MRLALTAFLLGAAAVGAAAIAVAFVVVVVADASGRDAVRVGLGGVELLSFDRRQGRSETAFGPGLLLLPAVGGALNAVAAALLDVRGRRAP